MTVLCSGIVSQMIVRGHARGHRSYIPCAKAQFSLKLCSSCVDCSLIIGMPTQADLSTVADQLQVLPYSPWMTLCQLQAQCRVFPCRKDRISVQPIDSFGRLFLLV